MDRCTCRFALLYTWRVYVINIYFYIDICFQRLVCVLLCEFVWICVYVSYNCIIRVFVFVNLFYCLCLHELVCVHVFAYGHLPFCYSLHMAWSCNKYIFYIFIVFFHNAISSNPPSSQGEIEPLCDTHITIGHVYFFLGKVATYKNTYYCF